MITLSHAITELAHHKKLLEDAKKARRWWQSRVSPDYILSLQRSIDYYSKLVDDIVDDKIRQAIFSDRRDDHI